MQYYPMEYLGHILKNIFCIYLKFKYNFCLLNLVILVANEREHGIFEKPKVLYF